MMDHCLRGAVRAGLSLSKVTNKHTCCTICLISSPCTPLWRGQAGSRLDLNGVRKGLVKPKPFRFKTFSHPFKARVYNLFYKGERIKEISERLITDWLTARGLAYWIMCEFPSKKRGKSLIIHTKGFTRQENDIAAGELNQKWGLHCRVIFHKQRYCVIQIDAKDASRFRSLLLPYLIPSMQYKCPLGV